MVASLDFQYKMVKAEATLCGLSKRVDLGWLVGPLLSSVVYKMGSGVIFLV